MPALNKTLVALAMVCVSASASATDAFPATDFTLAAIVILTDQYVYRGIEQSTSVDQALESSYQDLSANIPILGKWIINTQVGNQYCSGRLKLFG